MTRLQISGIKETVLNTRISFITHCAMPIVQKKIDLRLNINAYTCEFIFFYALYVLFFFFFFFSRPVIYSGLFVYRIIIYVKNIIQYLLLVVRSE